MPSQSHARSKSSLTTKTSPPYPAEEPAKDPCVKGRIYSDQRCPICNERYYHNEKLKGLVCHTHQDQRASRFVVRFGRKLTLRFKNYEDAARTLTGLRYEVDQSRYDIRNYQKGQPLLFVNASSKYLEIKKREVSPHQLQSYTRWLKQAAEFWGEEISVKIIDFGMLEDFLNSFDLADTTRDKIKSCLHTFFEWCKRRKYIQSMP